jgi:hypothetical protein
VAKNDFLSRGETVNTRKHFVFRLLCLAALAAALFLCATGCKKKQPPDANLAAQANDDPAPPANPQPAPQPALSEAQKR